MPKPKTDYTKMKKLDLIVQGYVASNDLEFQRCSEFHTKIISPNVVLSLWTGSGKYYIEKTDFRNTGVIERQGEKGHLPVKKTTMADMFNRIFFAVDML